MVETPQRLHARLNEEGLKSIEFFQSLEPRHWDCRIYSEGNCWSARQILAHFVSAERGFNQIIQDVLDGGEGAPESFDTDRFNESEVAQMAGTDSADLLRQFEKNRRANIELVGQMATEDLAKVGRHPFLGRAALEDIIKLLYRHNQIHQRDIRRALIAGAGEAQE